MSIVQWALQAHACSYFEKQKTKSHPRLCGEDMLEMRHRWNHPYQSTRSGDETARLVLGAESFSIALEYGPIWYTSCKAKAVLSTFVVIHIEKLQL